MWAAALLLCLGIFIPYFLGFRRREREVAERRREASAVGADRPVAQHPIIDDLNCIGCGACVDACPEGEVLGLVGGRAVLVNGLKCVGHGRCAEACPVEGLKVGLGDIGARKDIPYQDDFQETNLPGVFVAGELSGYALIRNAIAQGERVVERVVEQRADGSGAGGMLDLVVVGAGPAGLSAGLTARRAGLEFVILEREGIGGTILQYPRKKLVLTQPVTVPLYGELDREEYSKEELIAIWQEAVQRFELPIETGRELSRVEALPDGGYRIWTGEQHQDARNLILALGRRGTPRKLEVPGERSEKVFYKLLDAASYRGERVLVVGGGDSAVEAAMGLARQEGTEVTLSYRRDQLVRIKRRNAERLEPMLDSGAIRSRFGTTVGRIDADRVTLEGSEGEEDLANDRVFIFAGGIPPFGLLESIGFDFGGGSEN